MINKNTQQNTNVTTGTKSESSVYLKKSELEQAVTSLRKDIGYLIEDDLSVWLKKNSYLTKSEINNIINKSNITLMDNMSKSYDDDVVERLDGEINGPGGIRSEIVEIKDHLNTIDGSYISSDKESTFATTTQIEILSDRITEISDEISGIDIDTSNLATKDEIPTKVSELENDKGYLTEHQDLTRYAKKTDLNGYATESWVQEQGYLTEHQDISGKADRSELEGYVKTNTLNRYLKKTDMPDRSDIALKDEIPSIEGLASETWVQEQGYLTEHQDLSNYAKKSEIPDISGFVTRDEISSLEGYVSQDWVESQGYLTKHQDLSEYTKKSYLYNYLTGYATESWVQEQGYLTEHQDLSDYAKTSDLSEFVSSTSLSNRLSNYVMSGDVYTKNEIDSNFLSKDDAREIYTTKSEISDTYLSKIEAVNRYLQIEDYRGIKDATLISNEFQYDTEEEFEDVIIPSRDLLNGFYIVNDNSLYIVKDGDYIPLINKGERALIWDETEYYD